MVRALELAIEALGNLPAADQERMGRQLLTYIEKLLQLRIEVEKGIRVLEEGPVAPFATLWPDIGIKYTDRSFAAGLALAGPAM